MMRKSGLKLVDLQSEAVNEIQRITNINAELYNYQTDLHILLGKVASPENRVKTLSLMIASRLSKIKSIVVDLQNQATASIVK